ncbi:hypothetical protein GCM10008959_14960 [Deinococcus seoulensis]|uniref:Uncharacterized protein n=1 Tax=Deinococcus seoulensis TaxID=1837379 RepID=A0ABQ2RP93_9DEIO|nr:hypothetical protein [Deinococcus seoulensis]GGR54299.1 hypothetical protein GCM10008959_14960 [Deinococcus seoulensis]
MSFLHWLITLLAAALAFSSVILLGRSLPRVSWPGVAGELLTFALMGVLLTQGAPLYALLAVLLAGGLGTALVLGRLLKR